MKIIGLGKTKWNMRDKANSIYETKVDAVADSLKEQRGQRNDKDTKRKILLFPGRRELARGLVVSSKSVDS